MDRAFSKKTGGTNTEGDPFDVLYNRWAERAIQQRLDPPSRERWDSIVLRLLLSEDPDRIARYRNVLATGEESLGADAYALWRKLPDYTPNLIVPSGNWPDFRAYETEHRGSMRRLMESSGLLDRYNSIVEAQNRGGPAALTEEQKARARRAQASIMIIGCAGMTLIAFMLLTVLLIIALRLG